MNYFYIAFISVFLISVDSLADENWLTVQDTDLKIQSGSALDFSKIFSPKDKIDTYINVNNFGKLAKNGGKGKQIRFLCAPYSFNAVGGFPSHEKADLLAEQLSRHGYNLFRFHYVENDLMRNGIEDFQYNYEQLDRFHYLMASLKKQGIRWMIDAATSRNGAYGDVGRNRYKKTNHNLKSDIYFKESSRRHWKKIVDMILLSHNIYTGEKVITDKALLTINVFNEMGFNFVHRKMKRLPKQFHIAYDSWKKNNNKIDNPKNKNIFISQLEKKTYSWMQKYLQDKGFKGLLTGFNNGKFLQSISARNDTPLVSLHAYFDHPSNFVRKGSSIKNISSIYKKLPYVQYLSSMRFINKPFIVDEYDHPFWSRWRREAGITVPAYASFQDWDGICRFKNPVELEYKQSEKKRLMSIYPFSIGLDPISRANETLAALLFRRADVSKSKNKISFKVVDNDIKGKQSSKKTLPHYTSTLAFLTKVGIGNKLVESELLLPLIKKNQSIFSKREHWFENINYLKEKKLITQENFKSVKSQKKFISDTNELVLIPGKKLFTISTPKTEAVSITSGTTIKMKFLTVNEVSTNATISVSSIDDKILSNSKRFLIIVATDAVNSGAIFKNKRTKIVSLGVLPIKIENILLTMNLAVKNKKLKLYALALNGERIQTLPLVYKESGIEINIDLSEIENGPTTFFELVER